MKARGRPTSRATSTATACASTGTATATAPPPCCCCRRGRSCPSRHWKFQVPHLARHHRVVTFDGRATGQSDRPAGPENYTVEMFAGDALAVLDATAHRAGSARRSVVRVAVGDPARGRPPAAGQRPLAIWARPCRWRRTRRAHRALVHRAISTPTRAGRSTTRRTGGGPTATSSSTSPAGCSPSRTRRSSVEDFVAWAPRHRPGDARRHRRRHRRVRAGELPRRCASGCAVPCSSSTAATTPIQAAPPGAPRSPTSRAESSSPSSGGGHGPLLRDPVFVNRLIEEFVMSHRTVRRAIPSPHVDPCREPAPTGPLPVVADRARARAARCGDRRRSCAGCNPTCRSTGSPSTRSRRCSRTAASAFIRRRPGWPTSRRTSRTSAGEHDLHCFQAIRSMDEILVNNFMVFHDVVTDEHYDLVIGDEAWDVDYFLHENPELKHFEFAWMTDFVGWLPMPDGGEHEAALTADYNAEMIEQRARYRRLARPLDLRRRPRRHRARLVRAGTAGHPRVDRGQLRVLRLRHRVRPGRSSPTASRCATSSATAPTSASASSPSAGPASAATCSAASSTAVPVGPPARRGPARRSSCAARASTRASLPVVDGVEYRGYVPQLYRHLAACDLAIVQGGLTTCMELDREPPTVRVRPAAAPLRAELPRPPPAAALPGRPPLRLRRGDRPRGGWRRSSPTRSVGRSTTSPSRPTARPGAAASIAELVA